MAELVGKGTEEGATSVTLTVERGYLTKRTATKTGTVEGLSFVAPAINKATKFRLALFSALAEKPHLLLEETGTITVAKETSVEVKGTVAGTAVTEGTEYFLGVLTLDVAGKSAKFTEKAGWGFESTLKITELGKGAFTTAENKFGEPGKIWATGTEGGGTVTAQCQTKVTLLGKDNPVQQQVSRDTTTVTFRDGVKAAQTQGAAGTAKATLKDQAGALQAQQGNASTRVVFRDQATGQVAGAAKAQAKGALVFADSLSASMIAQAKAQAKEQFMTQVSSQQRIVAGVVARYSFHDGASVQVMSKVQALTRLQFVDATTPTAMMQAQANAKIVIADKASAQQVQQAAGQARLVFAGEAQTKAEGGGGETRHVAVFIFED